ncbi:MAG: fasciclin domain-containing protein, partial [Actinomycetota bacterium]|nr:fasciclin domain-containing protein [Actinomycetota bacterium]
ITVFVAVDAVYDEIPANVLDSILADDELLTGLLSYSVIPGNALDPADLVEAGIMTTASGADLTFAADDDVVLINDGEATICSGALFRNGIILIVDTVLQPPSDEMSSPGSSAPGSSVPAFTEEQEAVATAFETAVDSTLTYEEQTPFIEDAEALRATIEHYPAAADVVMGISAEVASVSIDGETAAITYVLSFNGVDAGYGELDATMALLNGAWVVPTDEYCAFQAQARNNCPE